MTTPMTTRVQPGMGVCAISVVLAAVLCGNLARAQQVRDLNLEGVPPDLISPAAPPSAALTGSTGGAGITTVQTRPTPLGVTRTAGAAPLAAPAAAGAPAGNPAGNPPISLGQDLDAPSGYPSGPVAGSPGDQAGALANSATPGPAARAAQAARARPRLRRADLDASAGPSERVTFERAPVRVPLPVGRERMVTLPAAAALHVPSDMEQVARIQNIDRTLYITALAAFTPIRIVAELLDTGQRIPMDFVADRTTTTSTGELQVSVIDPQGGSGGAGGSAPAGALAAAQAAQSENAVSGAQTSGLDMVELTRYAARQLYAPARLATGQGGVIQIAVAQTPVPTLIRGVDADIVPLGAWRSGPLYVTAVRVTNRSRYALEIPLEQLRGNWIAATAQHARLGAAGSDTSTTALYLVSGRPFEASL